MTKKKNLKRESLTDHITYHIEDSTIYLLLDGNVVPKEELNIVYKKITLIIEDNDLSYINISGKHLEENKEFFQELGFTLSYYDTNKLNELYKDKKDKISYKCYGLMTKTDFMNRINEEKKKTKTEDINVINTNDGFVSSMALLFGGIALLCYFCVQGAIYLIR